jgi:hypothetical protein
MANLLDHVPAVPLLESLDHWPATASRQHYFELTRELVASTIAQMDLPPQELAQVEEAFISAGLL